MSIKMKRKVLSINISLFEDHPDCWGGGGGGIVMDPRSILSIILIPRPKVISIRYLGKEGTSIPGVSAKMTKNRCEEGIELVQIAMNHQYTF